MQHEPAPAARPSAWRGLLAPFREGPGPWLVFGRNAIPVVGVHLLGWSTSFAVLEIWLDGVASLGILLAFATAHVVRHDPDAFTPPEGIPRVPPILLVPLFWLFPFAILGLPYWFTFGAFHARLLDEGFWREVRADGGLVAALGLAVLGNLVSHARRGYLRMGDLRLRRVGRREIRMHLARVMVVLMVVFFFPIAGISALALALTVVEIHPSSSFRLLGLADGPEEDDRQGS